MHWYTADLHFGHQQTLDCCKRPFSSVKRMDDIIVQNIVELVGMNDDLWIIGDFASRNVEHNEEVEHYFHQLPGRKHLIVGNHDNAAVLDLPWQSTGKLVEISDENQLFTLCHYPMITWNNAKQGALHLFGHVHDRWAGTRNSINVGVDQWSFFPVNADSVISKAKTLPANKHWNDVEFDET